MLTGNVASPVANADDSVQVPDALLHSRSRYCSIEYATFRRQFKKPIGAFQAVRHKLVDVALALEFARTLVYRAGADPTRVHASMAKAAASDAAMLCAHTALQVHGAIGYSFEHDLHLWMKRVWALAAAWGDAAAHRATAGAAILE